MLFGYLDLFCLFRPNAIRTFFIKKTSFICIYRKKAVLLRRLRLQDIKTEKIFCSVIAQGIFFEKKFGKFINKEHVPC